MPAAPNVAAIVLAAGRSTRMGAGNSKLTADVAGKPMVRHVVEAALASRARPVVVVVGHQQAAVREALAGQPVIFVTNADYASGLASSLKQGIAVLPADSAGALVLLGDMPQITAHHLDHLIAAFTPGAIVVPTHGGKRGNPVLWPADYFEEILQLEGDAGAKRLMSIHAARIVEVDLSSDAIFLDVDTPDALDKLRGG